MPTLPTQPKPITSKPHIAYLSLRSCSYEQTWQCFPNLAESDAPDKIIDGGLDKSIQSEVVYIGAGIGGGIVIVVLFVMIIVVLMCWKRT